jgi:hypothetical protein
MDVHGHLFPASPSKTQWRGVSARRRCRSRSNNNAQPVPAHLILAAVAQHLQTAGRNKLKCFVQAHDEAVRRVRQQLHACGATYELVSAVAARHAQHQLSRTTSKSSDSLPDCFTCSKLSDHRTSAGKYGMMPGSLAMPLLDNCGGKASSEMPASPASTGARDDNKVGEGVEARLAPGCGPTGMVAVKQMLSGSHECKVRCPPRAAATRARQCWLTARVPSTWTHPLPSGATRVDQVGCATLRSGAQARVRSAKPVCNGE